MATDRDDEARSLHWSVMEWEQDKVSKLSLSHKVRSRGECYDWSHPTQSNDWVGPLDRVLIGDTQPTTSRRAPVTQRYKREVGAGALDTRFDVVTGPYRRTLESPLIVGSAASDEKCRRQPSPSGLHRVYATMTPASTSLRRHGCNCARVRYRNSSLI